MERAELIASYYGLPALPREALDQQRVMNGVLGAILETDYYLWKARIERQEARWREWLRFDEQEESLCRGEMK